MFPECSVEKILLRNPLKVVSAIFCLRIVSKWKKKKRREKNTKAEKKTRKNEEGRKMKTTKAKFFSLKFCRNIDWLE
jgi:hypothetical protein